MELLKSWYRKYKRKFLHQVCEKQRDWKYLWRKGVLRFGQCPMVSKVYLATTFFTNLKAKMTYSHWPLSTLMLDYECSLLGSLYKMIMQCGQIGKYKMVCPSIPWRPMNQLAKSQKNRQHIQLLFWGESYCIFSGGA